MYPYPTRLDSQNPKSAATASSRAFTLVELLVVIGIIALLLAILLPTLSKARQQSHWAVCMSNMNQIGKALMSYALDNHDYLPRPASRSLGPMPDDFLYWQDGSVVVGYARDMDASPLAKSLNLTGERLKSLFRCPSDNYADRSATSTKYDPFRYSYSMNRAWEIVDPPPAVLPLQRLLNPRPTLMQVRRPAEKVLVVEEANPNDGRFDWNYVDPSGQITDDKLAERHSGQTDILYNDMHVERKFWKDIVDDYNNQKHPFEPTAR
jgi:prepilin-type N-terminal cleavage/methylation domain-containing protein